MAAAFSRGIKWIECSKHYCERCLNNRDRRDGRGVGCPLDDMHMEADPEAAELVIPESLVGEEFPFSQCSMFVVK